MTSLIRNKPPTTTDAGSGISVSTGRISDRVKTSVRRSRSVFKKSVGDYSRDNRLLPFIREQYVFIAAHGLRPGAKVHFYFDGENVDSYVREAKLKSTATSPFAKTDFSPIKLFGEAITVNSDGSVFAQFHIPQRTFYIGDREMVIADVSNYSDLSTATTSASVVFNAFNFVVTGGGSRSVPPALRPSPTAPVTRSDRSSRPKVTNQNQRTRNPLSQTFFVSDDLARGEEGLFVSKVDLYFAEKDDNLGVTLELRTVENGYPTSIVIPYSRAFVESANVNTSNTAANATTFEFEAPVFLSSGEEYCFVVTPDGNSPNYKIWTSVIGNNDVASGDPVVENWGEGVMFFSTNGTAWTPVQDEDIKFKMYRADFSTASTGTVALTNKDYEFFTISSINRTFNQGEYAFKDSTALSGTVSWNRGSDTITGTSTAFQTDFNDGDFVVLNTDGYFDVLEINSIANNTSMTVNGFPKITSNATALHYATVVGKVEHFDRVAGELTLVDSTSNTTVQFAANDVIIGEMSGANCVVDSVDNFVVNRFQPTIYKSIVHGTDVTMQVSGIDSTYSAVGADNYAFAKTNHFLNDEVIVASRSNEINNNSGNKSMTVTLTLDKFADSITGNARTAVSPAVNMETASIVAYENKINNDTTNEHTRSGNALTKYITKPVTLVDGLDSEDIKVFLTAHRPSGSDIKVYAKILNADDPDLFENKDWSLLEYKSGEDLFSDNVDLDDWKEYEFGFTVDPESTELNGGIVSCSTGNNVVVGSGTDFNSGGQLADGDYVIIYNNELTGDFQVARVATGGRDVDDVTLTLDEPIQFTNTAAVIKRITYPNSAYSNPQNGDVVRYASSDGVNYDTYKYYAIKIVLTSTTTQNVPRVRDMRAIALSV